MIGFMPSIYPDELVYSWFCRYFVHSGYTANKMALANLLYNRHCNPSKEFIGHLDPGMEQVIKGMYPMDRLILEHTMFPEYARFIDNPKKKDALHRIRQGFGDAHQLFSAKLRGSRDQYLKYCPLCAAEDREQYGEVYWHRKHQIRGMEVCARHQCRLQNSMVPAKSEQTFTLEPAETAIGDGEAVFVGDPVILEYAAYLEAVFDAPLGFGDDIPVSMILYSGMEATKYISSTGKTRNTKMLVDDMQEYYAGIGLEDTASMYQIQRTLLGSRTDFGIVCQIAFFLGMPAGRLVSPSLSKKQVAMGQNARPPKREIPEDWDAYDVEMLPVLEQAARGIYEGSADEHGRPGKVTERPLYQASGVPPHRLENMPRCREMLMKYKESYGETWARRLIWAYKKYADENGEVPVYWSDIREMSGVKKKNVGQAIPYLKKFADKETVDCIKDLLV